MHLRCFTDERHEHKHDRADSNEDSSQCESRSDRSSIKSERSSIKSSTTARSSKSAGKKEEVLYPWTGQGNDGTSKQFLLHCIGTRGDVQPLVVIAKRLMKDGHTVRLACDPAFKELVEKQGVSWFPITGYDPVFIMRDIPLDDAPIMDLLPMRKIVANRMTEVAKTSWKAATEGEVEVGVPFTAEVMICNIHQQCMLAIAEKLGIPVFLYSAFPILQTKEFRHPFGIIFKAKTDGWKFTNLMSWRWSDNMLALGFDSVMKDFRHELGLPEVGFTKSCTLQGICNDLRIPMMGTWSPNILPRPDDWHENAIVTGQLESTGGLDKELPADVEAYLQESDEKPIFFGFGSMANQAALTNVWHCINETVREMGITRAIFHVGKMDKDLVVYPLPKGVLLIDKQVDHATLFKRCSVIVHHGGAGTVSTALAAGKPNAIVSFAADQPFWGQVITHQDMGNTVSAKYCTTKQLTKVLETCMFQEDTKLKCQDTAFRISQESDGLDMFMHEMFRRMPKTGSFIDYQAMLKSRKWKKVYDQSHKNGVPPPLYNENYKHVQKSKIWYKKMLHLN